MLEQIKLFVVAALFGVASTIFSIVIWSATFCQVRKNPEAAGSEAYSYTERCKPFETGPIVDFLTRNEVDISAGITAIATFTIAWFTITLSRVGRRQISDTRILQRAYLGAEPRGIAEMQDKTIIAHVAFVNSGNLPARNVRNNVKIGWFDNRDKIDFDKVTMGNEGGILLLPKMKVERGTLNLSDVDAAKYREGRGFIYVWGRAEYEDGFNQTRWLIFCHRYNCSKPDAFRHHHHHNDGD